MHFLIIAAAQLEIHTVGELRRAHRIKIKRNGKKLAFNFSSAQLCEKRREQKGGESWLK